MPLYMDVHYRIAGLTAKDVAEAHRKDLRVQSKYNVKFRNYWYDEKTGRVYCLSEAPDPSAPESCHREAHGLLADEITEVKEGD